MKKLLLALILFIGTTSIVNAEDKTPPCFKDLHSGKNIFKQILGHANHKDYVFPISNDKDLYLEIEIPEDHSHLSHKYSDPNFDEVIYFTNDSAQHEKITIFINRRHKIKNTDYLNKNKKNLSKRYDLKSFKVESSISKNHQEKWAIASYTKFKKKREKNKLIYTLTTPDHFVAIHYSGLDNNPITADYLKKFVEQNIEVKQCKLE